ncbi:MAG TPA: tetratricopeptide repeat protein [Blastocatellia bacterium]|nr:tetratricopeptide repeat protein [Blastocatellia bacterium]HMX24186.1 tetratricopeptide repeat protein [Blastocatellia bacterium]HMY71747.1 tetratricopeptide repeat protein [Blastocatellia bacterium]
MFTNFRLLFALLWQPVSAVRMLRERAPVAFAAVAAWVAAWVYSMVAVVMAGYVQAGGKLQMNTALGSAAYGARSFLAAALIGNSIRAAMTAFMIVLFIAVIYVPFVILIANLFEQRASFSLVVREEYPAMTSCALLSLAVSLLATMLPAVLIGWQSTWLQSDAVIGYFVLVVMIPLPIFAWLMTLVTGTIFRAGWVAAGGTVLLSLLSLIVMPLFIDATSFVCASPILLILLLFLLRDRVDDFMRSQRSRQSFRQNLQAATLNPADASAHYNLALLYQQRGELEAAIGSFQRAIEIDPNETDAHYQLGRIARWQNRLTDAVQHFETVVQQDSAHGHHEIWRETALVYYAAKQYPDALAMFDRFLDERQSDAQARYWRGMTLFNLGRIGEAETEMQACIESVKSAPAYKYRTERQWLHLAQNFLRERQS